MTSKSYTLTSFIPRITSVVKSEVKTSRATPKRATGQVLINRSAAKPVRATNRLRGGAWVSMVSAGALATLVMIFGFYIYSINTYASKGYELKKEQAQIKQLEETNKRLVIDQAASGSIVKINDVASADHMVPVTGEEFLVANQVSSR